MPRRTRARDLRGPADHRQLVAQAELFDRLVRRGRLVGRPSPWAAPADERIAPGAPAEPFRLPGAVEWPT